MLKKIYLDVKKKDLDSFFQRMLDNECLFLPKKYGPKERFTKPFYLDVRRVLSEMDVLKLLAHHFKKYLLKIDFDVIAGCSLGGSNLAAVLAYELNKPVIQLRKTIHYHGSKTVICGNPYPKTSKIILVDDGFGTGNQMKSFLNNLRKEGYKNIVSSCIIFDLFTEEPGSLIAKQILHGYNIKNVFFSKIPLYLNYLQKNSKIPRKILNQIRLYFTDPLSH